MIEMIDLTAQHQKLEPRLHEAMDEVIKSGQFIRGADVSAFETEFANYLSCKHVCGCGNGTEALQLALMALDLHDDDEVITTAFSFISAAEVTLFCRLKPVFADIDPRTYNIDPDEIERLITPRTRAIIPVHLFGMPCDMERIMDIARRHNLYVIEDTAQATGGYAIVGGQKRKLGTIGDIGSTSFFPTKNLSCMGDGGALMTNNDQLAEKFKIISNHGAKKKYYNEIIGINSRLDSIQAAVLRVKLPHLDEFNATRRQAARHYTQRLQNLQGIGLPAEHEGHVYHHYTITVADGRRDDLKAYLEANGVRTMIYFPLPLNRLPVFAHLKYPPMPVAERIAGQVLSLPIHSEIKTESIDIICDLIEKWQRTN